MIAHMHNMKYLHACTCPQNWVRMTEPQATERGHKKYTHVWVRLASFPGSCDSERNFCWIEFMCAFIHLCTCPVTVVDLASIPGSCGGGGNEPGTHCWCMRELFRRIDRKIIWIIFMTTCWLYGYIISSILLSIYERSRERWLPWTHRFHRLSTWKDHNGETTSTTLELAELQLVLLRSVWSNRKGSVS